MASHLIFGCGYLGERVARAWLERGHSVAALTRGRSDHFTNLGIEPILGDVLDPASLTRLPQVQSVLYAVGMDRSAGVSMREVYVQGLANVLTALPHCERLLSISSTSVYGQTDGSLVDETSPTEPRDESGKIVLEAESILREKRPESIILRFAGIYGPGRILRQQALLKGEPLIGDAEKWLNLIHVDDGVAAILAAEEQAAPGDRFLVSDGTPVTRREFYTQTALSLGATPAKFEQRIVPGETNRRISNRKIREQLNFTPQYPSSLEYLKSVTPNS